MKQAFTLIELLVVVLIIGILSAIALPQYERAVEKARLSEVLLNMSTLQRGLDIYMLENGYPSSWTNFLGENANGKDILAVDIRNGLDCTNSNDRCDNKYFSYNPWCNPSRCVITVDRKAEDVLEDGYTLSMYKDDSTDGAWVKSCDYGATKEYICKGLESQGYTRSSCC